MHHTGIRLRWAGLVVLAFLLRSGDAHEVIDETPDATVKPGLAIWYQVDPTWPQRPDGIEWGAVPGIAVDSDDRVWVYTRAEPPIQVYNAEGKLVRAFGQGLIGTAHHIKIDVDNNVWVTDIGNHVVIQFSPQGQILRQLGVRGEAGNDQRHFNKPTDIAVTPEGDVFVSDGYGNNRVVHYDHNGKFVKSWGKLGSGPGEFHLPHAIAIDSTGRLYVADRSNARIQVFDQDGKFIQQWRNLVVPWGFAVTPNDEIWVCGSSPMPPPSAGKMLGIPPRDQLLMKLDRSGRVLQLWAVPKGEDQKEQPGQLNWVHGMAVDSHGNLYAGDITGKRAQKFIRHE